MLQQAKYIQKEQITRQKLFGMSKFDNLIKQN